MITLQEFYTVMTAVIPLYVAMILAYGSVRWWKLLTPLLSFQIISHNNPYEMNPRFVAADVLQKLIVLAALVTWSRFKAATTASSISSRSSSSLDWIITLFMVSTLPNTLVLGIPLEVAMYGEKPAELVVQAVVLQCIVWYTLLLFLYEYRSAKNLILEQFPGPAAANIVSFRIDPDVVSLDGTDQIKTEAEIGADGKIHVQVKRSPPPSSLYRNGMSLFRSPEVVSSPLSSKAGTPRASDLTGVEIYSLQSSRNMTPTGGTYAQNQDLGLMTMSSPYNPHQNTDVTSSTTLSSNELPQFSNQSSTIHTPRDPAHPPPEEQQQQQHRNFAYTPPKHFYSPSPKAHPPPPAEDFQKRSPLERLFVGNQVFSPMKLAEAARKMDQYDARDMHMLVWSSSTSPASDKGETRKLTSSNHKHLTIQSTSLISSVSLTINALFDVSLQFLQIQPRCTHACVKNTSALSTTSSSSKKELRSRKSISRKSSNRRCLLRFLSRQRNLSMGSLRQCLLASMLGLVWALIAYRWNVGMPKIIEHSITILSDAGLGMAMFSLGLFMALQTSIIACGTTMAVVVMIIRFITGPAIMSATSIAVGLRNVQLRASIIQAALPQGIVPFVFAKEYNVHPDVLSTAVIFGMLISLPINLLYYVLLGL